MYVCVCVCILVVTDLVSEPRCNCATHTTPPVRGHASGDNVDYLFIDVHRERERYVLLLLKWLTWLSSPAATAPTTPPQPFSVTPPSTLLTNSFTYIRAYICICIYILYSTDLVAEPCRNSASDAAPSFCRHASRDNVNYTFIYINIQTYIYIYHIYDTWFPRPAATAPPTPPQPFAVTPPATMFTATLAPAVFFMV